MRVCREVGSKRVIRHIETEDDGKNTHSVEAESAAEFFPLFLCIRFVRLAFEKPGGKSEVDVGK